MEEYLEHIIEETFEVFISTQLAECDINLYEQMIELCLQNGWWVCDLEPLGGKWALGAVLAPVGKTVIEIEGRLQVQATLTGKVCIDFDAEYGWEELPLGLGFINAMGLAIDEVEVYDSLDTESGKAIALVCVPQLHTDERVTIESVSQALRLNGTE